VLLATRRTPGIPALDSVHVAREEVVGADDALRERPRCRKVRPGDDPRVAAAHRHPARLDAPIPGDATSNLHDMLVSDAPSPEDLFSEAERVALVRHHTRTSMNLDPEVAERLLSSDNGQFRRSEVYREAVDILAALCTDGEV